MLANTPANSDAVFRSQANSSINGLVQFLKGKELTRNQISLDGHQGIECHMRGKENGKDTDARIRVYFRELRICVVVWMGDPELSEAPEIGDFFESFQFTPLADAST